MSDSPAPPSVVHPEGHWLEAVVQDEDGNETRVPVEVHPGAPISTHLKQATDDQGHVTLRLDFKGEPLGQVRIDLPPRPRGEVVWVWIELRSPTELLVELEHEGQEVVHTFTLD